MRTLPSDQSTDDLDRAELGVSAFDRGALFVMVLMSMFYAHEIGILPF